MNVLYRRKEKVETRMKHRRIDSRKLGFRKSSYSAGNGACVEVGAPSSGTGIFVRDSKEHGEGPSIQYSVESWKSFLRQVQDDKLR